MTEIFSLEDVLKEVSNYHKLAVTQWVFKHIVEHAREGGSYRYLIYDRLGFGMEAYVPLCDDGLTISNEFDITKMDAIKDAVREHGYDALKSLVGMCDEPNCYKDASCGWPSDEGYRHTCFAHMKADND
jgi:hypothetical protein